MENVQQVYNAHHAEFSALCKAAGTLVEVARALKEAADQVGHNAATCRGIVDTIISNMPRIASLLLCERHFAEDYLNEGMVYSLKAAVRDAQGARHAVYEWIQIPYVKQLVRAGDFRARLVNHHNLLRDRVQDVAFQQIDQITRRSERMAEQFVDVVRSIDGLSAQYEDLRALVQGMRVVAAMGAGNKELAVRAAKTHTLRYNPKRGQALTGHTERVRCVAWSPSGTLLATASRSETAIWLAADGALVHLFKDGKRSGNVALAWSPSGQYIATMSWDAPVSIWRIYDGARVQMLDAPPSSAHWLSWCPTGKFAATAAPHAAPAIWHLSDGASVHVLRGHSSAVCSVAWSPIGELIATASLDCTTAVWRALDGARLHVLERRPCALPTLSWSPCGRFVATLSGAHVVSVCRASDGARILEGNPMVETAMSWSASGEYVATTLGGNVATIWRLENGTTAAVVAHAGVVASVAFSPCGQYVVSASRDCTAGITRVTDSARVHTMTGQSKHVTMVSWCPSSNLIVAACRDKTLRLYAIDR